MTPSILYVIPAPAGAVIVIVPVAAVQVGCVRVTDGAAGDAGCALITTPADDTEVHPEVFVTAKVYVPVARSDIVVLVPDPLVVTAPGLRVSVHVPLEGNPLSTTLPVETIHAGWVIVPTTGADGVTGWSLITML